MQAVGGSITKSETQLAKQADLNKVANANYNQQILEEKEHFIRLKEFEDLCDKNDDLRARLGV